jgi:diketogulonate reductase-like aldo/keto reductase
LIGRVIAGQRDRVFLVSKVPPYHVAGDGIARACEASLGRLGTDHLDLYLLHWRNQDTDLPGVVAAFESLRAAGKIRAWGVSNFKVSDMEDLFRVPDGRRCATNQVRYNLERRGIEYDLLPWCEQRGMPVMAYSPLGDGSLVHDPTLAKIAAAPGCSATAVALAWAIRSGNVIAIPESGSPAHVKENAVALSLTLTPQELETLDTAHPARPVDVLRSLLDRQAKAAESSGRPITVELYGRAITALPEKEFTTWIDGQTGGSDAAFQEPRSNTLAGYDGLACGINRLLE